MPLPDDVQNTLTLLQVTGLVLPIVFIALRPFDAPESRREVLRVILTNTALVVTVLLVNFGCRSLWILVLGYNQCRSA